MGRLERITEADAIDELTRQLSTARQEAEALRTENERLRRERDEARRHPMAPERCPVCEWTNIHLMNYGQPGASKWLCHGCAARGLAERDTLRASLEQVSGEKECLLNVAYAASYYCNTGRGQSALYDAVRDREAGTDFAEGYRGLALRVDNQANKIGNLEADVKDAKSERDSAIAERDRLAKEVERVAGVVRAAKSWRVYVDTIGADETSDEEWDLRRAVDALATTGGSDV